ncbi:MAG: hypothetical protein ACXWF3_12465 [Solirubrobacterales bacterium]
MDFGARPWLLAQLLDYHRREDRPKWWEYFSRLEKTQEQLVEEDCEAMGGLVEVGEPEVLPPHIAALVNRAHEHPAGRYALELFSERPDIAVIVV